MPALSVVVDDGLAETVGGSAAASPSLLCDEPNILFSKPPLLEKLRRLLPASVMDCRGNAAKRLKLPSGQAAGRESHCRCSLSGNDKWKGKRDSTEAKGDVQVGED